MTPRNLSEPWRVEGAGKMGVERHSNKLLLLLVQRIPWRVVYCPTKEETQQQHTRLSAPTVMTLGTYRRNLGGGACRRVARRHGRDCSARSVAPPSAHQQNSHQGHDRSHRNDDPDGDEGSRCGAVRRGAGVWRGARLCGADARADAHKRTGQVTIQVPALTNTKESMTEESGGGGRNIVRFLPEHADLRSVAD